MISDIYDFLANVAANNNRPWFYTNRGRYDDLRARWYDDLEHLIACMSQWEAGDEDTDGVDGELPFQPRHTFLA